MIMHEIRRYIRETKAAIALMFAIMAPLLITTAGMSVDFAGAYLVKQRLAQAVDAAALAATAISTDADVIEAKVQEFINVNYPAEKLGAVFTPYVELDGNLVKVTGSAQYDTYFLDLIGVDVIDVEILFISLSSFVC